MGRRSVRIRNFFQGRKGSELAKCVHKGWVKETHRDIYIYLHIDMYIDVFVHLRMHRQMHLYVVYPFCP